MVVYFLFIISFFLMLYNIINGIFNYISDGFWGYYERIISKIKKYSGDVSVYGQDEVVIKTLQKQKKRDGRYYGAICFLQIL